MYNTYHILFNKCTIHKIFYLINVQYISYLFNKCTIHKIIVLLLLYTKLKFFKEFKEFLIC